MNFQISLRLLLNIFTRLPLMRDENDTITGFLVLVASEFDCSKYTPSLR